MKVKQWTHKLTFQVTAQTHPLPVIWLEELRPEFEQLSEQTREFLEEGINRIIYDRVAAVNHQLEKDIRN